MAALALGWIAYNTIKIHRTLRANRAKALGP
jgi:hypothetical protein